MYSYVCIHTFNDIHYHLDCNLYFYFYEMRREAIKLDMRSNKTNFKFSNNKACFNKNFCNIK